ncbi:MAG: bifunctional serine/threonine-protein kinase/formylglycine-generating enzyme family protein [Puniceicoccaceae bacterium]
MSLDNLPTQFEGQPPGSGGYLEVGQVFGQYRIVKLLGRGGMGEVYEARHEVLDTVYALKIIRRELMAFPNASKRFRQEARVMAKLKHPNIVRVDDFGFTEDVTWFRMDLVKGGSIADRSGKTLADIIDSKSPLNESVVASILRQILAALGYAHNKGIIHRDLKPGNILLGEKGEIRVADFGLVSLLEAHSYEQSEGSALTLPSLYATTIPANDASNDARAGTYEYMSPEQRSGRDFDHRSDLYSIGLIAYRLLTGMERLGMELPSEIVPDIHNFWDSWIRKATASIPNNRFKSANAMAAALEVSDQSERNSQPNHDYSGVNQTRAFIVTEDNYIVCEWIPPGSLMLQKPADITVSDTFSEIQITEGFWMGRYPVTQSQWQAVMCNNPSQFKNAGSDAPVEKVSWYDAQEFCSRLTKSQSRIGRLHTDYAFVLPSEVQWEFACRSNAITAYHSGDSEDDLCSAGWYSGNSKGIIHPVGLKNPNQFNLYDMHGNVWEWCSDWYEDHRSAENSTNQSGPDVGSEKVLRGGGWGSFARYCRSSSRFKSTPGTRGGSIGFRVALCRK